MWSGQYGHPHADLVDRLGVLLRQAEVPPFGLVAEDLGERLAVDSKSDARMHVDDRQVRWRNTRIALSTPVACSEEAVVVNPLERHPSAHHKHVHRGLHHGRRPGEIDLAIGKPRPELLFDHLVDEPDMS